MCLVPFVSFIDWGEKMLAASSLMRASPRLRTEDKGVEMNRQARRREKSLLRSRQPELKLDAPGHSTLRMLFILGEKLKKTLSQKTIADVKKDFCLAKL
jgi:hypothetical protein